MAFVNTTSTAPWFAASRGSFTGPYSFQWLGLCVTVGAIAIAHMLIPERAQREMLLDGGVSSLSFAHFIGAAWFSRRKMLRFVPAKVPPSLFAVSTFVGLVNLYNLYLQGFALKWPYLFGSMPVPAMMLIIFVTWHCVENDVEARLVYDQPMLLKPLSRVVSRHARSAGWTSLMLLALMSTLQEASPGFGVEPYRFLVVFCGGVMAIASRREPALRWQAAVVVAGGLLIPDNAWHYVTFMDLFLGMTLYHVLSWAILLWNKTERAGGPEREKRLRSIVAVHTLPLVAGFVFWYACSFHAGRMLAPAGVLFWSAAHVIQTALVRGVTPVESTA